MRRYHCSLIGIRELISLIEAPAFISFRETIQDALLLSIIAVLSLEMIVLQFRLYRFRHAFSLLDEEREYIGISKGNLYFIYYMKHIKSVRRRRELKSYTSIFFVGLDVLNVFSRNHNPL